MPKSLFIRLHAAGATHRELFLISEELNRNPDVPSGFFWTSSEPFHLRKSVLPFLSRAGVSGERAARISEKLTERANAEIPSRLEEAGVNVLRADESDYPGALKALVRHPFLLYVRGALPENPFALSVVGPRKASPYGRTVTERFVREFVAAGAVVVSGGAAGIDSTAHAAALDAGGATVAFTGTGIDVDYPSSNRALFDRIARSWAVVSAFPLGAGPHAHHFPIRNALVAAYSVGTLVTEAAENSGSLITARLALEFSKEVFAVPGDVLRPGSIGTNALIRDGLAKCALRPEDVLSEFPSFLPNGPQNASASRCEAGSPLLRTLRSLGPSDAETLADSLGRDIGGVLSELATLEVSGKVVSDLFGTYSSK